MPEANDPRATNRRLLVGDVESPASVAPDLPVRYGAGRLPVLADTRKLNPRWRDVVVLSGREDGENLSDATPEAPAGAHPAGDAHVSGNTTGSRGNGDDGP